MGDMGDMGEHHRSLARQLRRLGLCPDRPPDAVGWSALLQLVSASYTEADADRYTLERSLAVSSEEMRALYEVLSEQACHDALTGLPNRSALTELITSALARSRHSGQQAAVLFLDLDGFKRVNDSLGHAAGDELLVRAAERIRSAVRGCDVVTRLGGDEFVVLCPGVEGSDTATAVARRIAGEFDSPFRIGAQDATVGASIGIALAGPGVTSGEDLLRRADIAMYRAKTSGGARVLVFDDEMHLQTDERLATENALRSALQHDELVLHYQPIVNLADHSLLGAEALIRWNRPGHGLVPPDRFVPVAEATRLIAAVDAWVVQQACQDAASWPDEQTSLSVNLSPRSLQHDETVHAISSALHRAGLPSRRLTVELTETTLLSHDPATAQNLGRLQALGVQLAIDDFGTGYSSLSYLRRLPAQTLKIDRSFVSTIGQDQAADALVAAIITMGHALNLHVVAEGVERAEQAAWLRALGCDAAQGYLFARPQPTEAIADYTLNPTPPSGDPLPDLPQQRHHRAART